VFEMRELSEAEVAEVELLTKGTAAADPPAVKPADKPAEKPADPPAKPSADPPAKQPAKQPAPAPEPPAKPATPAKRTGAAKPNQAAPNPFS
jgi:hypothetical protein